MEAVRRRITCRLERIVMLRRIRLCRERLADRADGGELHAGQFPALEYIIRHDGCAQKELAAQFHVTPASVALTTKQMQAAGLIVKNADDRNLRLNRLSATEKGRRLAAACHEAFADFDSRVYAGLTEAELETLDRLLEKVLVNLAAGDDSYAPGPPVCGIDYGKNRNGENV